MDDKVQYFYRELSEHERAHSEYRYACIAVFSGHHCELTRSSHGVTREQAKEYAKEFLRSDLKEAMHTRSSAHFGYVDAQDALKELRRDE